MGSPIAQTVAEQTSQAQVRAATATGRIAINLRAATAPTTGVQRYIREIYPRLHGVVPLNPPAAARGWRGHMWEQMALGLALRGRLLWSPSNTGPLAVRHQVVTIHDLVGRDHPEWFQPRLARWYNFVLPRLVRRVHHVIAVSNFTKTRLVELTGVPESRITVVHHGVDSRFRPQQASAIAQARARLQLPEGPYVLTLGSVEPRKNVPRLLRAWEGLGAEMAPQAHLVVAGAPGNPAIYAAARLGRLPKRTLLLGRVDDELLPALYAGATAFVYVSLYEGFGFPPLEAMACGTAVLASNSTAFPEVLGDGAVLVDPRDEGAIAGGLRHLLEDAALRESIREAGLARAAQFSWDHAAAATQAILDRYA